jgi:hypothetical protein
MSTQKPVTVKPVRRPALLRTLLLLAVCFPLWLYINILYGAIPAIEQSGWLPRNEWLILVLAVLPSAVQYYISREHDNEAALFQRSPVFRIGGALLIFVWDIAFPAHGLMLSAGKASPWLWEVFGVAVVIQLAGSWYAQQAWTGALEDVWSHWQTYQARRHAKAVAPSSRESRPAAASPLPRTHRAPVAPPAAPDIDFSPVE